MAIKITGFLTETERARLNRAAATGDHEPIYENSFIHIGRNLYSPVVDHASEHNVARHMMTVAGRTFDYEVV